MLFYYAALMLLLLLAGISYKYAVKLFDLISRITDTTKICLMYGDLNLLGIYLSNGSVIVLIDTYLYSFNYTYTLTYLVHFRINKSIILDLILINDIIVISSISHTRPI